MRPRHPAHWLLLASATLLLATTSGSVDAASRKQRHATPSTASRDVTSRDIETEPTATIPSRPSQAASPSVTAPDADPLPPPFRLPTASRKRMRDCGMKWQAMKMSGEAGDDIWRAFATRCLAAADGPFDKRSAR